MGGGNSVPKKLTIDNPDDTSIIQVTENVVDRLQDVKKSDTKTPPRTTENKPDDKGNVNIQAVYVTSQEIRKQIEDEIGKNNLYWENRMKHLREGYRKLSGELQDEYEKAVNEVNQSVGKQFLPGELDINSYKNSEFDVIQCYKINSKKPLLCHEEVKKFNNCVINQTNALLKTK